MWGLVWGLSARRLEERRKTAGIVDEKRRYFVHLVQVRHVASAVAEVQAAPCARNTRCLQPIRITPAQVIRREVAAAFAHAVLECAPMHPRHRGRRD